MYIGRKYTEKGYPIFESLANSGALRVIRERHTSNLMNFYQFSVTERADIQKGCSTRLVNGRNTRKEYAKDGRGETRNIEIFFLSFVFSMLRMLLEYREGLF